MSVEDEGSQAQIRGMARAGCGTSDFISGTSADELSEAVSRQFEAAKAQGMLDISLQWNDNNHEVQPNKQDHLQFLSSPWMRGLQKLPLMHMPPIEESEKNSLSGSESDADFLSLWGKGSVTSPFKIPPVFSGEHLLIFTLFKAGHTIPKSLLLTAKCPDARSWTMPLCPDEFVKGETIHIMAARALVEDLDGGTSMLHELKADKQTIEVEMIETSCRYLVPSSKTVFVCVKQIYLQNGELESAGTVIPPPPQRTVNSAGLARMESLENLDDVWRRGRKSVARSFRIASINLRFAMAFSKFKSAPGEDVVRRPRSKLKQLKSSKKRLTASNRGPSKGLVLGSNKQGIGSKVKFFNGRKSSAPIVNPKLYIKGLLKMQAPNGSFVPFESVANYLDLSYSSFRSSLKEEMNKAQMLAVGHQTELGITSWKAIWGSCVVIAYLHQKLIDHKSNWSDAANRAELWLESVLTGTDLSAASIISAAEDFIAHNTED